mgnify:CR=1 FL=1
MRQDAPSAKAAWHIQGERGLPLAFCARRGILRAIPAPMIPAKTILLLLLSNVFMTFAWYAHLRDLRSKPLMLAIALSWGIAFFEYCFQVPANRIGHAVFTLPQLKILQEVITLTVFVPFAVYYMRTPLTWNYLWAGLCLMGAVYFIFKPQ